MPASLRMQRAAALPFVLLMILACLLVAQVSAAPEADALTRSQKIAAGVRIATNQVGDPYRYGAAGPGAFDCSGLVYYSMRKAGIPVPRTSSAQARYGHRIKKSNLRPGDLMAFANGSGVYHVGIYLGRRDGHIVMLHSPYSGARVRREKPWTSSWFAVSFR